MPLKSEDKRKILFKHTTHMAALSQIPQMSQTSLKLQHRPVSCMVYLFTSKLILIPDYTVPSGNKGTYDGASGLLSAALDIAVGNYVTETS